MSTTPARDTTYDVAIVGFGPGAQCLTALLARAGHRVIAFERYPYLYNLPRAGHIDHEAMRIVQNLGGADELEKTLWEVRGDYVWINREGQVLMLQPLDDLGENALSGWYSDYTQWQPHLEDAFRNAADACGAEIQLGWEAVGLQVRDDDATLTVNRIDMRDDGQRERSEEFRTVTARYVVGARRGRAALSGRPSASHARISASTNDGWTLT